jgi:MoxR-like ATPase
VSTPASTALAAVTSELKGRFFERDDAVEAIVLAALAGEHVFLLGPPGTAKTDLSEAFAAAVTGANYASIQVNRYTPPEDLYGQLSVKALMERDLHRRNIEGFLPWTHFALVDEIGKSNPATQHVMLRWLNERRFRNGSEDVVCPLVSCITASNELLTTQSEEAAAFWDRLLVRELVDYIAEDGNFVALLKLAAGATGPATTIDLADMVQAVEIEVPAITVPDGVFEAVLQLRSELRGEGLIISDRRFRKTIKLIQAAAYLDGRDSAGDDDLAPLRFALWDDPETQRGLVHRKVLQLANPFAKVALDATDAIEVLVAEMRGLAGQSVQARAQWGGEAAGKLNVLGNELAQAKTQAEAAGRSTVKIDEAIERLAAVRSQLFNDVLGPGAVGRGRITGVSV